ncbi:MAG: hypothetical protein IKQ78_04265 [Bacilli bacterium]|nr:hypothetical protein [Bacilli bacterium]
MKKGKLMLVSLLSVLSFSLSSCQKKPDHIEVDGLEEMILLYKKTFNKTFVQDDITIRWEILNSESIFTERIKGTTSYLLEERQKKGYSEYITFRETWSFIDEKGEMISATKTYFDENLDAKEEMSYKVGSKAYGETYKTYYKYFIMAENFDSYLKPNSKEGGENDYSTDMVYKGEIYNYSNFYNYMDDWYNFSAWHNDNEDIEFDLHGDIYSETELVKNACIHFTFPSEAYSPFDETHERFTFKMSYGENEKIGLPDISSWKNKTSL